MKIRAWLFVATTTVMATVGSNVSHAQSLGASHAYMGTTPAEQGERHTFHITILNAGPTDLSNIELIPAPIATVVPYDMNPIHITTLAAGDSVAVDWFVTLPLDSYVPELPGVRPFAGHAQLADGSTAAVSLDSIPDATQP